MATVARDGFEVVALGGAERSALDLAGQEQVAEPDDAIERGAELMRDVGEELVLQLARLIELDVQPG